MRRLGDHDHVMEKGLVANVALVKAWKADSYGNFVFRKSARNFDPMVATCSRVTVAEVEEIVVGGTLDPDQVHTPGLFVQRLILATCNQKRIEQRTVRTEAV